MDQAIKARLRRGMGANAYSQVVTTIVQLVGVPIFLSAWGPQLYGEWLLLFAMPSYLSMSDLGFSLSTANDMSARAARNDFDGALNAFQTLVPILIGIFFAGLLSIAVLYVVIGDGQWFHLTKISFVEAKAIVALLAAEVFVRLLMGLPQAALRANGQYATYVSIDCSARLCQYIAAWLAATLGFGPIAAALGFLGVRAVFAPAMFVVAFSRHKWLRIGISRANRKDLRRLIKPAIGNIAMPAAQALSVQGMLLVVGAFFGAATVVVFATLRTLTRFVLQLVQAISNAAEPEIAGAYGKRDLPLMRRVYSHTVYMGFWAAILSSAALVIGGPLILRLWTHGKVPMDRELFWWLLASSVASVLWYTAVTALKAANLHARMATALVVLSVATLGLAALLITIFQTVASAGAALLLTDAAMTVFAFYAVGNLLKQRPYRSFLFAVSRRPN